MDPATIVPFRPAGWRGHPTATGADRFVDGEPEDDDPAGRLSFTALRAIVAGLSRVSATVPPVDRGLTAARSLRLLATTFYDVWMITWPDGSGLGAHDHGGSRGVLQVVDGELIETFSDQVDQPTPRSRVLRRGDVTATPPSFVHELANRSGGDTTTIHAYSPPLADIGFFSLEEPGRLRALRTSTVADRVPQASTRDLLLLGPAGPRPMGRRPGRRPPPRGVIGQRTAGGVIGQRTGGGVIGQRTGGGVIGQRTAGGEPSSGGR